MSTLLLYRDEINRFVQTLSTPEISAKISKSLLTKYSGRSDEQYKFMYYLLRKFPNVCFLIEPEMAKFNAALLIDYARGTYNFKNKFKELLYQCIANDSTRFIVIPINIYWTATEGHNEVIIIDKIFETIERFEPYGQIDSTGVQDSKIEKVIQAWGADVVSKVTDKTYIYYSPNLTCPTVNWQTFQETNVPLENRIDPGGYCVAYSLLYTELRLKFPDIPQMVLQEQLLISLSRDPALLLDFIRNYTYSIIEDLKDLKPENAKSAINSILYSLPTFSIVNASADELKSRKVYQLEKCDPESKRLKWGGTLKGRLDIGCAINVLTFLGYFDVAKGEKLVESCDPKVGTPFEDITKFINTTTKDVYGTGVFNLVDIPVITREGFTEKSKIAYRNAINKFFILMHEKLEEDTCTIIKMERLLKCSFLGHTVVLAKKDKGLYTIDPQVGKIRLTVNNAGEIEFGALSKIVSAWEKSCVIMVKYMYLLLKLDTGIDKPKRKIMNSAPKKRKLKRITRRKSKKIIRRKSKTPTKRKSRRVVRRKSIKIKRRVKSRRL